MEGTPGIPEAVQVRREKFLSPPLSRMSRLVWGTSCQTGLLFEAIQLLLVAYSGGRESARLHRKVKNGNSRAQTKPLPV
jgi:hypothetical protein